MSLYRESDAIYIAKYDKAEDLDIIEDSGASTVLNVRKHFDVSSVLKGEPRKLFVMEEREYRYKTNQGETPSEPSAEEQEEVETMFRRPDIKSGDTVLLFLKQEEQEDGTELLGLTDYRDAIKKLSPERLSAYEARIRELNSIFGGKVADDAAIVDWLVRVTEDPLTRWEGAYDLHRSFEVLGWRKEQEQEQEQEEEESDKDAEATSSDGAETVEEKVITDEPIEVRPDEVDQTIYARLMTDAQKETLTNLLVASTTERKEKSMSEGDKVLVQLVANWGDSRLAKFLLQKMQGAGDDQYVVYQLMTTTVKVLRDKELEEISEKYGEIYYEDGDAFVDADDEEEAVDEDEVVDDSDKDAAIITEKSIDPNANAEDVEAVEESTDEAGQVHRVTYGELRTELLMRFTIRSIAALAEAEKKDLAKNLH
ncbi:MAG TPA: hypothetical protein VJV05_18480 [Pyrinomonadaceae bacterium]|nr:hypothetical protein [Pyrinomonadaceae bacterium]